MGIEWVIDPVEAWMGGYNRYTVELIKAITEALEKREQEIQQWLKDNHIWMNRTGLAEQGLGTKVFRDGLFIYVIMYYAENTWYSRFLEGKMHSGDPWRFSLLGPALDFWGPILVDDIRKVLGQ